MRSRSLHASPSLLFQMRKSVGSTEGGRPFRPAEEQLLSRPGDPHPSREPGEGPNVPSQNCRSSRLFGARRNHCVVDLASVHAERPGPPKRPPSPRRGQMHHLDGTPVRIEKGHGGLSRQSVGGGQPRQNRIRLDQRMGRDQEIIAAACPAFELRDRSRMELMPTADCGHETACVLEEATHGCP